MKSEIEELKKEIAALKERNRHVEADKEWETSFFRKTCIFFTTYVLVSLILYILNNNNPLLNAIIPAIGYALSTLSLSLIKNYWMRKRNDV